MIPIDGCAPQLPEFRDLSAGADVETRMELLPDGRDARIAGDAYLAAQADETIADSSKDGFVNGGLLGCEQIIRQFDPDFDVRDLIDYAELHDSADGGDRGMSGVAAEQLAQTLADFEIPAHVEQAQSSEDLAHHLESGSGVMVAVNLGELWNSAAVFGTGDANAIAVALAVAREPLTGDILGWYLNDVAAKRVRTLVDAPRMERAWLDAGGWLIVTEIARRRSE